MWRSIGLRRAGDGFRDRNQPDTPYSFAKPIIVLLVYAEAVSRIDQKHSPRWHFLPKVLILPHYLYFV